MQDVVRLLITLVLALGPIRPLFADNSSSAHFKIDESVIGSGGRIDESSASYHAAESIGDIGVANSASTNFQTNSGYTTTSDPALTFIIDNGGVVNFGALSSTVTTHATSTFRVINYTSYGYQIIITGTPPDRGGHTLPGLTSTASPTTGVEEYGLNLVANTGFGTNPTQIPDTTFGFGVAQGPDYNQANKFKFLSGDAIASAPKSSGETDFTMSYIIDVSALTPGGTYATSHELICIGTY